MGNISAILLKKPKNKQTNKNKNKPKQNWPRYNGAALRGKSIHFPPAYSWPVFLDPKSFVQDSRYRLGLK